MMITTSEPSREDFYIGYEDRMPGNLARHVTRVALTLAVAAAFIAAVITVAFATLPPSRFEYGVVTTMAGVLRQRPYPTLNSRGRRVWLVGKGKFGAERLLAGLPDGPTMVTGARIARGRHEMLELHSAVSIAPTPLRGEIVDSKCFLGVMNPGEGAVHRDCAVRCLHGGITPMIRVRLRADQEELIVPVSADGGPIGRALAPLAGRTIEVTGQVVRDGADYVIYADPSAYQLAGRH